MSTMSAPRPLVLDYAPDGARRWKRRGLLALLLLAVATPLLVFRKPLVARAELLYWQRQCMQLERPRDCVAVGGPVGDALGNSELSMGLIDGHCLTLTPYRRVPQWEQFSTRAGLKSAGGDAVVFLHRRDNAFGERLVVVTAHVGGTPNGVPPFLYLSASVVRPGSMLSPPAVVTPAPRWTSNESDIGAIGQAPFPDLHAGQVDSRDPRRFTIAYHSERGWGQLAGTLRDDDTVAWE